MGLHHELMAKAAALDTEIAALHAQAGTVSVEVSTGIVTGTGHGDRVAALLAGVDYQPPANIRDQIADKAAERRAIDEALRGLAGNIAVECQKASRLVVGQFDAETKDMAREFFKHIASAAAIHAKFGELRRQFHRAGVDPAGMHNFGGDVFGEPGHRNGDVGIAMRAASRRGYLKESEIPEFAR